LKLREFCDEAEAKRGDQRRARGRALFCAAAALGVEPLAGHPVALALDATTLGTRFTVLAISVVDRGCAIPVALTILPANQPHAWRCEWLHMLRQLRPAIPQAWTVMVLADRGLYAGWLFRRLARLGGHPFLRINAGGTFRPDPPATYRPLRSFVPQPGTRGQGTGTAFKRPQRRLRCTLRARWEEGYADPWLIRTDVPPAASAAGWYGLRAWIEPGVKVTKRAGWQWQRTRMTAPQRAARLWLAVAVATLWLLSVGGAVEEAIPASTLLDVSAALASQRRQRRATRLHLVNIFRRGWMLILVALLDQAPWQLGAFVPEPWPTPQTSDGSVAIPDSGVLHEVAA